MKKILLLSSLLVLMAIPSLAQTFDLIPAKQPDSPVSIELGKIEFSLLTEWKGREYYQLKAPLTFRNISNKDISTYKIFTYKSNQPFNGSTLTWSSRAFGNKVLKPGDEFNFVRGGDNYPKVNDYKIAVIFVEFTDGTTWRFTPENNK